MPRIGAPTEPAVVEPRAFFEEIIPAFLEADPERARSLATRLGFRVVGVGDWTVDLGAATVTPALGEGLAVFLEASAEDFAAMLRGAIDLDALVDDGRVRVSGRPSELKKLAALLSPG
jgi:hypothetical protein